MDCDPRPGGGCPDEYHKKPLKFLDGVVRNGGGDYFDGVSFHAYDYYYGVLGKYGYGGWNSSWNSTGLVLIAKANFIKEMLESYGVSGKFLMNTESALLCDACSDDSTFETTKA